MSTTSAVIPQWDRFEELFTSNVAYPNPLHDARLRVTFTAPSGTSRTVDGFWDGEVTWRVRFSPSVPGRWQWRTTCTDKTNAGLHDRSGTFACGDADGATRFGQHGPVRLSANRRYLAHTDGTPFFWMSDTVWAGPLRSTAEEWLLYLDERVRQGFTAAQWVTTQFVGAPDGDLLGEFAYTGERQIAVNPPFFRRLDARLDAMNYAGLLAVPVLLWAAEWSPPGVNAVNPGFALPDDEAIRLARYMIARWDAHHVAWILPGDGDYRGEKADKWRRIGRALFAGEDAASHAPVVLHPAGMQMPLEEFRDEEWLSVTGYQSGHGDDARTLSWMVTGPPATAWQSTPPRPIINLEPPYENHIAYQSKQPFDAHAVRRALYWSLLNAPTAGVTYGGHGVWGWDDGSSPPANHPSTGIPLPWREALRMDAAEQVAHVVELFTAVDWWTLHPEPDLLATQPGDSDPARHVLLSRSAAGDLLVAYSPVEQTISLHIDRVDPDLRMVWFDPRTGSRQFAAQRVNLETRDYDPPGAGDWVLLGER